VLLTQIFSGQAGGHLAGLAPLIGEILGVKPAPIEYRSEGKRRSGIRPARTARPLTLGQLITLLDNVDTDVTEREWLRHGWVLSLNESNRTLDNFDPVPYRDFTRVSSEFYPEFSEHYERLFDRWIQAYRRTDEESDA
jgi:hypothetical protein